MTNYSLVSSIHAKTSLFFQIPKGGFHPHLYFGLNIWTAQGLRSYLHLQNLCCSTQNPVHAQHWINQILPFTSSQTRLKTTLWSRPCWVLLLYILCWWGKLKFALVTQLVYCKSSPHFWSEILSTTWYFSILRAISHLFYNLDPHVNFVNLKPEPLHLKEMGFKLH